jgi:hypothetical protein
VEAQFNFVARTRMMEDLYTQLAPGGRP